MLFDGPINRFQNTFETEELASHGFIVVAIDHPYDSDLIIFPDGRRVPRGKGAVLLDFTSEAALHNSRKLVEQRLEVRVADAQYILDKLKTWNESDQSRFFERLDLQHIGMFGHSFGGAVAAEMCRVDPRVGAGVDMDGTIFGTAKSDGIPKPFLTYFDSPRPADAGADGDPQSARERRELRKDYAAMDESMNKYGGYFVRIQGMEHMNFTDLALFSQVRAWTDCGIIGARRAHELINRTTLAFFRRELLHDRNASVEGTIRAYPEAVWRRQSARGSPPSGS